MDWRQDSEKPLPRGLEHVSHLFLSQTQRGRASEESCRNGTGEQAHPATGDQPLAVALRPCRFLPRDQLVSLVRKQAAVLEEGMKAIDANITCDNAGNIEVLALDRASTLVIVDLDDHPNDELLLRGIGHLDWVVRNISNMVRMYRGQVIDFSLQPRLFLAAPEFSPLFQNATRHFTSLRIDCLRYHSVAVSGGTGIFFEHVFGNGSPGER